MPTDAKVALLDRLSRTGVERIEAVSFVRPSAIPQMADADEVWKRAARFHTSSASAICGIADGRTNDTASIRLSLIHISEPTRRS